MNVDRFRATLGADTPPDGLDECLLALWHVAKGHWDIAHGIAQNVPTPAGSWVHGYIHLVEGNAANARYWYNRAGRTIADSSLQEEWNAIAGALLGQAGTGPAG